mgnify:CR=1 FL=1
MEDTRKKHSDKQEKTIARYLGWKQISGSGSRPFAAGDIRGPQWLGECKTHITSGNPIIFYFNVWDKIVDEAKAQFYQPVLFVDDGSQLVSKTLCLLDVTNIIESNFNECEVVDNKKSIRYNNVDSINPKFISRNNSILCVMKLEEFKEFIELGV